MGSWQTCKKAQLMQFVFVMAKDRNSEKEFIARIWDGPHNCHRSGYLCLKDR